jgi:pimeloyl-ACP methyl ester carboxylesterase
VWTQAGESTTLVFLHYWGGSHHTFDPVIARLASVSDALQHMLTERPLLLRERVINDSLAASREAQLAWPLDGVTKDVTAAVGAIDVPVQVLAGRQDRVDPPERLEANLLTFIPGARNEDS